MAITRQKKETQVEELAALFGESKLTALALYQGLTVKDLQALRRAATAADVKIKVVKNRLVRVAMSQVESFKSADTTPLKAQLLYAISTTDEVAPAQVLAKFAKDHEALQLIGAYDATGNLLAAADVKA